MTSGCPWRERSIAFEGQDFEVAIDELQRVRRHAQRFGGSHAQRDLLQLTTTEAALRAGRRSLARALIAERLAVKPSSVHNLQLRDRAEINAADDDICAA